MYYDEHVLDYRDYQYVYDLLNTHDSHIELFRYFKENQNSHIEAYLSYHKLRETHIDTSFGIVYSFPSGLMAYFGRYLEETEE